MIKMIYCIRRNPDMSYEEFQTYWKNTHGTLVRKNAPALAVRRYVQSRTLDVPINDVIRQIKGHAEPFDGVAELWWDSLEAFEEAANTPEGIQAQNELFEDEQKFIDFATSCSYLSEEDAVFEG